MQFELVYHHGFFEITTSGDADRHAFADMLDALLAHPEWAPGKPSLHDHSNLNAAMLTAEDVGAIAQFCADRRHLLGRTRAAIVVPGDLVYGLARMWSALVENRWDGEGRVFRSRHEAVAWLGREASA